MSEYQYYEFLAVDRPLTAAEQAEIRQLSTRARITATSISPWSQQTRRHGPGWNCCEASARPR